MLNYNDFFDWKLFNLENRRSMCSRKDWRKERKSIKDETKKLHYLNQFKSDKIKKLNKNDLAIVSAMVNCGFFRSIDYKQIADLLGHLKIKKNVHDYVNSRHSIGGDLYHDLNLKISTRTALRILVGCDRYDGNIDAGHLNAIKIYDSLRDGCKALRRLIKNRHICSYFNAKKIIKNL